MDVDIVYITGPVKDPVEDMPLRWSLRSLDKFASGVGRVVVCGRCPDWLSDEAVKIPVNPASEHGGKSWNILYAYQTAVERAGIKRKFLYSSDDHYLCRPSDMRRWPRYFNAGKWGGKLMSYAEYVGKYRKLPIHYQVTLFKTHDLLAEHGLSLRRACVHLNTWADPRDVRQAVEFARKYEKRTVDGFEPTCLINAFFERRAESMKRKPAYTPYFDDQKVKDAEGCAEKLK